MENASKALLIAGAILIAILLIGIAMMVFGNINGITGMAGQQVDAMEIQGFNRQFEQYAGENVSGSNVRTLLENINASNATCAGDKSKQIVLGTISTELSGKLACNPSEAKDEEASKITGINNIGSNFRYKVTFDKEKSEYINKVNIEKKN